jgi:transposase-like protein
MDRSLRKKWTAEEKAKIAFEAAKGEKTIAEISSKYKVHSTQVVKWKKQLLENIPEVFSDKRSHQKQDHDTLIEDLYQQIGQVTVERDWLKKKRDLFR